MASFPSRVIDWSEAKSRLLKKFIVSSDMLSDEELMLAARWLAQLAADAEMEEFNGGPF